MPQKCHFVFDVEGNITFRHDFEKMLEKNKIIYLKIPLEDERVEKKKGVEKETASGNLLSEYSFIPPREIVEFVIAITPTVLQAIYNWYNSRKKNGEILIRTRKGTVRLSAGSVRNFEYTEVGTRKSTKRKKATKARKKQVRNLKSAQQ